MTATGRSRFTRAKGLFGIFATTLVAAGLAAVAQAPPAAAAATICTSQTYSYTMEAEPVQETIFSWHQDWPGGTKTFGDPGCQVTLKIPSKRIIEIGGAVNIDSWSVSKVAGAQLQSVALNTVSKPYCTAPAASGYVQANRPSCSADIVTSKTNMSKATVTFDVVANPVLTVDKAASSGIGTVTSTNVSGIVCGTECKAQYTMGTKITLAAQAAGGSTFQGWAGAGASCGSAPTCDVFLFSSSTVSPIFTQNGSNTLSVVPGGTGSGTVTSNPSGINCGTTCSAPFTSGQQVGLTATPAPGSSFAGWGASCSGMGSCTVNMVGNQTVVANFSLDPIPTDLVVTKNGTGSGTVTSDPSGVNCGPTCAGVYDSDTTVVLSASADPGSVFTGWSSAGCSGTGTCAVTLRSDTEVFATFTANVYQPDGLIAVGSNASVGDGVYNATGKDQTRAAKAKRGKSASFKWTVQSDGNVTDVIALKQAANATRGFKATYAVGKTDITKKVNNGKYKVTLDPGGKIVVKVKVSVLRPAAPGSLKNILLTATSKKNTSHKDAVRVKVTALR